MTERFESITKSLLNSIIFDEYQAVQANAKIQYDLNIRDTQVLLSNTLDHIVVKSVATVIGYSDTEKRQLVFTFKAEFSSRLQFKTPLKEAAELNQIEQNIVHGLARKSLAITMTDFFKNTAYGNMDFSQI